MNFSGKRASAVYVRSDRKIAKNTPIIESDKKMNNQQTTELINRCKHLKHRFRGIFPANLSFRTILKRHSFFTIVNAFNSDQSETHWLLFAQAGGQIFRVAHVIFSFNFPIGFKVNDHGIMHFAKHMML